MEPDRRNVLFLCDYHEPLRSTVLPLCRALERDGLLTPHVILERPLLPAFELCQQAGVRYEVHGRVRTQSTGPDRPKRRSGLVRWVSGLSSALMKTSRRVARLTALVERYRPAALVLLDDRTVLTAAWVAAARRRGVPTIVVQWAAVHDAPTMIALRAAQPPAPRTKLAQLLEARLAQRVPGNLALHQGQPVTFMGAATALALQRVGGFPRHSPWSYGGGNGDVVAAMGDAWKRRMVAGGVPAAKVVVTGHPDQDQWFHLNRARSAVDAQQVLQELDVPPDAKLVTIVAPALCFRQPRGARVGDISLAQLQDSLRAAVRAVQRLPEDYVAVVKVHPRDDVESLQFLRNGDDRRLRIVRDIRTDQLMAASQAVLCQWSTSVMIAQALGRPVLLMDFYDTPSAAIWRDISELPSASSPERLDQLLADTLLSNRQRQPTPEQQRFVNDCMRLDGCATERLVALIYETAGIQAMDRCARTLASSAPV